MESVEKIDVTLVEETTEVAPYGDYGPSYYVAPTVEEVMRNKKGKKIRNPYALRLVLSILELVFCYLSLFLSIPAGILGIVFSKKANKAYKAGKVREFNNYARTAIIILAAGALSMWIVPIVLITGNSEGYITNENADHPDFEDFNEFTVDGTTLSIPCTYQDLEELGYFMDYSDTHRYTEPGYYKYEYLHTESAIDVLYLCLHNDSTEDAFLTEMSITSIAFWNCMGENDQWFADYEFVNGLRFGMTEEEVLETLGEPNTRETWEDDEYTEVYLTWDYSGGEYCYISVGFVDGLLEYIEISNEPEIQDGE